MDQATLVPTDLPAGSDGTPLDPPPGETGPELVQTREDYLATIFRRSVAAIVGSNDVAANGAAFDYIVHLAELRFRELVESLKLFAEVQRRTEPSLQDIALLFTERGLNVFDLLEEMKLRSQYTAALDNLKFDPQQESLLPDQVAFFDANEMGKVKEFLASVSAMPGYAPEWAPPLPPDHAYKVTPLFTNQVRDLRFLRERLVEEGHLAEKALQRLLSSGGSVSAIDLSAITSTNTKRGIAARAGLDGGSGSLSLAAAVATVGDAAVDPLEDAEDAEETQNNSYITVVDTQKNALSHEMPDQNDLDTAMDGLEPSPPRKQTLKLVIRRDPEAENAGPKDPEQEDPAQDSTQVQESKPLKPISFKISLGKNKLEDKETVEPVRPAKPAKSEGSKRPRVDIVALAQKRSNTEAWTALTPDSEPGSAKEEAGQAQTESSQLESRLQAALASVGRT